VYRVVREAIEPAELVRIVSAGDMGAIATFFGTVRIRNAGKEVVAVEYHAYPAMAERMLEEIGREMERGFGPLRVALVHRIGRLEVGEISVGIAAAAPHRRQALDAVAHAIERLKQRVPVWKREFYADGSAWLEPAPTSPSGEHG